MPENPSRTHSLAACYENAFTIILRLTTLQQQANANAQDFRASIRAALRAAMEQAKALGYSSEANQLAFFAVVSLLDESVLKLQHPAFAEWAQRPLQEEMFGHNRAGEVFFDNLRTLLAQQDTDVTADLLEVYVLCMLLGFKGKYALSSAISYMSGSPQGATWAAPRSSSGEIHTLVHQAREKIDRIRGAAPFLPDAPMPEVKPIASVDGWSRGLGLAALILFVVLILSFAGFWFVLGSRASQLGLHHGAGRRDAGSIALQVATGLKAAGHGAACSL